MGFVNGNMVVATTCTGAFVCEFSGFREKQGNNTTMRWPRLQNSPNFIGSFTSTDRTDKIYSNKSAKKSGEKFRTFSCGLWPKNKVETPTGVENDIVSQKIEVFLSNQGFSWTWTPSKNNRYRKVELRFNPFATMLLIFAISLMRESSQKYIVFV